MPAFADGQWLGFRAVNLKEGSLVSRLGLQRGDVIRAVNGRPLTDLQSALSALSAIGTSSDFDVELERGGQPVHARLRIE